MAVREGPLDIAVLALPGPAPRYAAAMDPF